MDLLNSGNNLFIRHPPLLILPGICAQEERHEVITAAQAILHLISLFCEHICRYGSDDIVSLPDVLVFLGREVMHHRDEPLWEAVRNEGEKNLGFGAVP